MKLVEEIQKQISNNEKDPQPFEDWRNDRDWIYSVGVLVSHNEAKQIVKMYELLEQASGLIGNPGTNISSSTDLACDSWQERFKKLKEE